MEVRRDKQGRYWAIDPNTNQWRQTKPTPQVVEAYNSYIETKPTPHLAPASRGAAIEKQRQEAVQREADYQDSLSAAEAEMVQHVRDMPFWKRAAIGAARETEKLGAGTAEVGDFLMDVLPGGHAVADWLSGETPIQRTVRRRQEQTAGDELFRPFEENEGFGGGVGRTLPYILSGRFAEPAARAAVGGTLEGLGAGARRVGGAVGREGARQVRSGALGGTRVGRELEQIVVDPVEQLLARMKARPDVPDPFRQNRLRDAGAASLLGSVEGGLHYDEDMDTGALNSLGGWVLGKTLEPALSKSPNMNPRNVNEILDEWEQKGYRVLPGVRTGQPKYQRFESDLRTDEAYSGHMHLIDKANQEVLTRHAGKAIGYDGDMTNVTPKQLEAHVKSLKSQFDEMEEATTGRITPKDFNDLVNGLKMLPEADQKALEPWHKRLRNLAVPGKDKETGRFTKATFSGSEYKKLRSKIKNARDGAHQKGDRNQYEALDEMLRLFDGGIERGLEEMGGAATAAQWRDLREKYALTNLLMEKGMDVTGQLNTRKLGDYLISDNAQRLLTSQGGRVKEFQDIVKIDAIQRNQSGSGLNRLSVDQDILGETSPKMSLLSSPMGTLVPYWAQKRMELYEKGWPAKTGYLGMSPDAKYWSAPKIGRAVGQGMWGWGDTRETVEDARKAGEESYEKIRKILGFD